VIIIGLVTLFSFLSQLIASKPVPSGTVISIINKSMRATGSCLKSLTL
jgi:hypothetical protein